MTCSPGSFYRQFSHLTTEPSNTAVELEALKMYWASTADCEPGQLLMRQVIDGADMMVHVASGPTKVQVSLESHKWYGQGW